MRKITGKLLSSNLVNAFLLSILFFLATYLFVGNNLGYLSRTQQEINEEFLVLADYLINDANGKTNVEEIIRYAESHNLGVRIKLEDGSEISKQLTEQQLILRLEFGGSLVSRKAELKTSGSEVYLTYFRPFFANDNTMKFIPAFLRLTFIFLTFALLSATFSALSNIIVIKKDLNKAKLMTSNLVMGSYQSIPSDANLAEFRELMLKMDSLRDFIMKKEDLKKRMTSDFAHELRTPLTTLQSHLEALIDGVWEPSKERFISCHEEILRLIRLVGDLEKLYKLDHENIALNKNSFDFTELVKSISVNFQGEFNKNNIDVTFVGNRQEVLADKDKISQVVVNLFSNSLKYTPFGGKILINVKGDKSYVYLIINDSGIGIPEKDKGHVFDRLYRSDTSRTRSTGGAGIGLTIAKSIVDAHNGSIDIVSQEGLGTEVTVILPKGL